MTFKWPEGSSGILFSNTEKTEYIVEPWKEDLDNFLNPVPMSSKMEPEPKISEESDSTVAEVAVSDKKLIRLADV